MSAPPTLLDEALAAVREGAGPTGWGRVSDDGGAFLVAARAVVSVAGHAARAASGIRMALGAVGALDPPTTPSDAVAAGLAGQSVAVELTVAAEYGQDLHRLADRVRDQVTADVLAQTGLQVVQVDVTITDVFAPVAG